MLQPVRVGGESLVNDMTLADLANRYAAAARERQRARATSEVAVLLKDITQRDTQIAALSTNIARAEQDRDQANMSRSRNKSNRRRPGGQRERKQANANLSLYSLRQERKSAVDERNRLDETLRHLTQEVDAIFYAIRHELLEVIYQRECAGVPAFVARKQILLDEANIDPSRADEYRSDVHRDDAPTANLFYGGLDAPDGPGHGHVTLTTQDNHMYSVTFSRPPDPQLLRFP